MAFFLILGVFLCVGGYVAIDKRQSREILTHFSTGLLSMFIGMAFLLVPAVIIDKGANLSWDLYIAFCGAVLGLIASVVTMYGLLPQLAEEYHSMELGWKKNAAIVMAVPSVVLGGGFGISSFLLLFPLGYYLLGSMMTMA